MDWYAEGRRWVDRWFTGDKSAYEQYGHISSTHKRALERLTPTSATMAAAQLGWHTRMREIARMSMEEIDALLSSARG